MDSIDGSHIRKEWHNDQWYYSIIDMVGVLLDLDHKAAQNYYHVFKGRLQREGNQTLTNCKRLKLVAEDGKQRLTDVVNTEEALRVIQSIPSAKLETLKLWLAQVGTERFQETSDPELGLFRSLDRTTEQYLNKRENPRDHFGKYALIYTRLAEEVSTERLENLETVPMSVAMEIVWQVTTLFRGQAQDLSKALGYDLVTEKPLLSEGRRKPQSK